MPKLPAHNRILTPRRIRGRVEAALRDTRVVLIAGPRQAGKTTLARELGPKGIHVAHTIIDGAIDTAF